MFNDSLELDKFIFNSDFLKSLFGRTLFNSNFGLGGGSLHRSGDASFVDVLDGVRGLLAIVDELRLGDSLLMECFGEFSVKLMLLLVLFKLSVDILLASS